MKDHASSSLSNGLMVAGAAAVITLIALYIGTTYGLFTGQTTINNQIVELTANLTATNNLTQTIYQQLQATNMQVQQLKNTISEFVMMFLNGTASISFNETIVETGTFDWSFFSKAGALQTFLGSSTGSIYTVYDVSVADILSFQVLELRAPLTPFTLPSITFTRNYYVTVDNFSPGTRVPSFAPTIPLGLSNQNAVSMPCYQQGLCSIVEDPSTSSINLIATLPGSFQFFLFPNTGAVAQAFDLNKPWRFISQ